MFYLLVSGALKDLDKTIQLSKGQGTAACQAYTQRGLLKKRAGMFITAKSNFLQLFPTQFSMTKFANFIVVEVYKDLILCIHDH